MSFKKKPRGLNTVSGYVPDVTAFYLIPFAHCVLATFFSQPAVYEKIGPKGQACTAAAPAVYSQTPPSLPEPGGAPHRRGPDLRLWRLRSAPGMLKEAWLHSGRRTGSTSGPCPEGKRRHRRGFPVAQAHAYRTREETCAAWPLGWVSMESKSGLKLWRKPQGVVRSLPEMQEGRVGVFHFQVPQNGKNLND